MEQYNNTHRFCKAEGSGRRMYAFRHTGFNSHLLGQPVASLKTEGKHQHIGINEITMAAARYLKSPGTQEGFNVNLVSLRVSSLFVFGYS